MAPFSFSAFGIPRTLPLLLNEQNRFNAGFIALLGVGILYLITNHIHMAPPQLLEMSRLDLMIPFIPGTIWLYHSDILLFIATFLLCKDLLTANKYLYAFVGIHILSNIVFLAWPTTYPRNEFLLNPATTDSWTYAFFAHFRSIETPANCFPSLHVGSVFVSAFSLLDRKRWIYYPFLLWAIAVSISTLTTKQHYIQDVFAGLFLAVLMYGIFFRTVSYRPTEAIQLKPII